MYARALMAFLHHLAAFTVVACLAVEVALFKPPLTLQQAIRLQRADIIFGVSAGTLLAVGLLRVFFFEKGAGYYFGNGFFLAKLTLFVVAALISIYPTALFVSWNRTIRQGVAPVLDGKQIARARLCMMWELTAILGIILCAPLMARGLGMLS